MELPPYRRPTVRSVAIHVWMRSKQYLQKMGTVILAASIIVWFMSYYPRQNELREQKDQQVEALTQSTLPEEIKQSRIDSLEHSFATYHQEQSIIGRIGHLSEPVIRPLGFDWKMGVSIVSGSWLRRSSSAQWVSSTRVMEGMATKLSLSSPRA